MRWIILAALLLIAGCPGSGGDSTSDTNNATGSGADNDKVPAAADLAEGTLLVYADPILRPALEALSEGFKAKHAPGWHIEYMERAALQERISAEAEDARPDVVLCDKRLSQELIDAGVLDLASSRTFCGDRLVVISRSGEEWKPASFFDLYKLRFTGLGVGEQTTSLGFYGDMAFLTNGSRPRVADRLKAYPGGQEIFDALEADEVQLALVFASIATQKQGVSVIMPVDETYHEDIRFQASALSGRAEKPGVMQALVYLAEDKAAQGLIIGYGLQDRETAMREEP